MCGASICNGPEKPLALGPAKKVWKYGRRAKERKEVERERRATEGRRWIVGRPPLRESTGLGIYTQSAVKQESSSIQR